MLQAMGGPTWAACLKEDKLTVPTVHSPQEDTQGLKTVLRGTQSFDYLLSVSHEDLLELQAVLKRTQRSSKLPTEGPREAQIFPQQNPERLKPFLGRTYKRSKLSTGEPTGAQSYLPEDPVEIKAVIRRTSRSSKLYHRRTRGAQS